MLDISISLGSGIFEPLDSVYLNFLKEKHDFDIIVQKNGQNSSLIRAYSKNNKFLIIEKYDKNHHLVTKQKEVFIKKEPLLLEKGDYFFLCNQQSTHLPTHIYALKIEGEIITVLWFDNGNHSDLSIIDKEKLKNTLGIISLIEDYD